MLRLRKQQYKVDNITGCWNWLLACHGKSKGYGILWMNGKNVDAHRFYYEKHKGKILKHLQIDHLCKNTKCVNPRHLEAITCTENIRRSAPKLTLEKANEIKKLHKFGYKNVTLSKIFNISEAHSSRIINNLRWAE